MDRRKELILVYKQTPTPMGVYQIANCNTRKVLIGSSMNLPGKFNSLRFQLKNGTHPSVALQLIGTNRAVTPLRSRYWILSPAIRKEQFRWISGSCAIF